MNPLHWTRFSWTPFQTGPHCKLHGLGRECSTPALALVSTVLTDWIVAVSKTFVSHFFPESTSDTCNRDDTSVPWSSVIEFDLCLDLDARRTFDNPSPALPSGVLQAAAAVSPATLC